MEVDTVTGIAQFLLVTGITFALFALLASHLRFQRMTQAAHDPDAEEKPQADAFAVEVAHRLGTVHRVPDPFVLILLQAIPAPGQTAPADPGSLLGPVEKMTRETVRADDAVMRYGSDRIGVLAMATRDKAEMIARRILDRTRHHGRHANPGLPQGIVVVAGLSTHPENGNRTQALFQAAQEALDSARQASASHLALAATESAPPEPAASQTEAPRGWLDELTGVLCENRLTSTLQRELSRHRKENRPLSLLLVDVDHLGRYNEHYGRETGDALLKGVADGMQHHVREADLIGRMEGDSFLLIMDCTPAHAQPVAQRLINKLRKTPFTVPGGSLRVNVSVGVAGYPDHAIHPRDLMKAARYALRAAKSRDGSRYMLFEPAMQTVAEETPREVDAL